VQFHSLSLKNVKNKISKCANSFSITGINFFGRPLSQCHGTEAYRDLELTWHRQQMKVSGSFTIRPLYSICTFTNLFWRLNEQI